MVHSLDFILLNIQIAITNSASPINFVNKPEWASPRILDTISWCLGTKFRSLQKRPLIIQTVAIRQLKKEGVVVFRFIIKMGINSRVKVNASD
jgi:hypothetical protein